MKSVWFTAFLLLAFNCLAAEPGAHPHHPAGSAGPGHRFDALDTDKDGKLSLAEAQQGAPRLAERFSSLDKDKDGLLTKEEMRAGMREHHEQMRNKAREAFATADVNHDGKLSKDEAQTGMPRVAQNFQSIDADGDGFATPEEMRAHMRSKRREHHGEHPVEHPKREPAK